MTVEIGKWPRWHHWLQYQSSDCLDRVVT